MDLPDIFTTFAKDAAASPVLEALRKEKWRQARDRAKELCKKDRARYLPLLVAANIELARSLIERQLFGDARTVLDALRAIAPAETVAALELALRQKQEASEAHKRTSQAAPSPTPEKTARPLAELWQEAVALAERLQQGQEPTIGDIRAVDEMVTFFNLPREPGPSPLAPAVLAELTALHRACEEGFSGQWESATETLRALSARSPFRHWRMFLRGARLLEQGQINEGRKCFATLLPGTVCALLAETFQAAEERGRTKYPPALRPTALVGWLLARCGESPDAAADLLAAEAARKKCSLQVAIHQLGKVFREYELRISLSTWLLRGIFYYKDIAEKVEQGPFLKEVSKIQLSIQNDSVKCTLLGRETTRLRACHMPPEINPHLLLSNYEDWMAIEKYFHGPQPRRDSLLYERAGEAAVSVLKNLHLSIFLGRSTEDFEEVALRAFDQAIEKDPDNVSAWLAKLKSLDFLGKKPTKAFLREMTQRFPRNKEVLSEAGYTAEDMGWFDIALGSLEQALALDPLDRMAKIDLLNCFSRQIILLSRAAQPPKPDQLEAILEKMEVHLDATPQVAAHELAKWVAYAQLSTGVKGPFANRLLREARALAPHVFDVDLVRIIRLNTTTESIPHKEIKKLQLPDLAAFERALTLLLEIGPEKLTCFYQIAQSLSDGLSALPPVEPTPANYLRAAHLVARLLTSTDLREYAHRSFVLLPKAVGDLLPDPPPGASLPERFFLFLKACYLLEENPADLLERLAALKSELLAHPLGGYIPGLETYLTDYATSPVVARPRKAKAKAKSKARAKTRQAKPKQPRASSRRQAPPKKPKPSATQTELPFE